MNQIIPILPCPAVKEQAAFYEQLGFETVRIYARPYPYAVLKYGTLEFHFYGNKRIAPDENPQMCYVRTDDVDRVYEEMTSRLKEKTGKIPRSGIPRISKLKDLADDRRFYITDMGGNTVIVGMPNSKLSDPPFFRTIESKEHSGNFEILYDLLYSKEDSRSAFIMLQKLFPSDFDSIDVGDLDMAKLLLLAWDIHRQRNIEVDPAINGKLKQLLDAYDTQHPDWNKIKQKYDEMLDGE